VHARLAENLAEVRERIARAAQRSGRSASDITLVAVTKYASAAHARALVELGCRDLGESRPQELWRKADVLQGTSVRWHLIGHLQRNKVERTVPLVSLVHSLDSVRLLEAVKQASRKESPVRALLEVNCSGDATKQGLRPEDLPSMLARLPDYPDVQVVGLMTMAAREGDLDVARRNFAALRMLRDDLRSACPANVSLNELSMGMSGDYEVAIEEGATLVRVGSALFDGLEGELAVD
jgi:hypothetical protein